MEVMKARNNVKNLSEEYSILHIKFTFVTSSRTFSCADVLAIEVSRDKVKE